MLLGLHFRVAEGVAHGAHHHRDRHSQTHHIREVLAAGVGIHLQLAAFAQCGHTVDGDAQAVVHERLGQSEHTELESARPSLQCVVLRVADGVGAEFEVPWQCLLESEHEVTLPSAVALIEHVAAHVHIAQSRVHHQAGLRQRQPVGKHVERAGAFLHDVAVGGVEHAVLIEAVVGDAVVAETLMQAYVHHQFLGERAVGQTNVVHLLHVEVGISVGHVHRVGAVHIRVEVGDARTGDAHVVGEADILGHARTDVQAQARHKIAIVG